MAIDYKTPVGQVRLRIADLDEAAFILTDDQISGYLAMNDEDVRLAAADALDAIATSESLLSKAIRTQDLTTDGPKVAADLRKHAATLRVEAAAIIDAEGGFFEIIGGGTRKPEGAEYRW